MSPVNATESLPAYSLHVRAQGRGEPAWRVLWRHRRSDGALRPVNRTLGAAWLDADPQAPATPEAPAGWRKRAGRPRDGALDHRGAQLAAERVVRETLPKLRAAEQGERPAPRGPVTLREIAAAWLEHGERVKRWKPSTARDARLMLAEPGRAHKRGHGASAGLVMRALGDVPASEITARQVNELLREIAATGASDRTVNKYRGMLRAIYNHACRAATFDLAANPVRDTDARRQHARQPLDYYRPEEVEAIARVFESGAHRRAREADPDERHWQRADDRQDADAVRLAAYTGLRRGELVALRWRDVDWEGRKLTVRRALSAGEIQATPKGGRAREVPLSAQAAAAFDRLSRRDGFTGRDDYVLVGRAGGHLDPDALSRRYTLARNATGLRPLPLHSLRHAFGSGLVAAGLDLATVQAAMGHASITTTQVYLHARPANEVADRFTEAFNTTPSGTLVEAAAH